MTSVRKVSPASRGWVRGRRAMAAILSPGAGQTDGMTALDDVIRTERAALISLLETLTPAQWATPSLCAGWRVQDVAGHLAWAAGAGGRELLTDLVRAGARPNRMIADAAVRWSRRGPTVLVEELRRAAATGAKPDRKSVV